MKRKLKTLKVFIEEFKPLSDYWDKDGNYLYIIYNDMIWFINPKKKKLFGTEIEVEEYNDFNNYTHKDIESGFFWHELWFEQEFKEIEFLSMS